jgi:hypothetical protein
MTDREISYMACPKKGAENAVRGIDPNRDGGKGDFPAAEMFSYAAV